MPREIARVVADALQGLQYEGRIQRHLEMPRVLHRAREQAPQARAVFLVELRIAGNHFGGELAVQPIERLQRQVQMRCETGFLGETGQQLGVDFRRYVILGACNPSLAHRALAAELGVGLLLPCNVVVYEADGGSVVEVMDPVAALAIVGNPAIEPVAREAKERLERAIAALGRVEN